MAKKGRDKKLGMLLEKVLSNDLVIVNHAPYRGKTSRYQHQNYKHLYVNFTYSLLIVYL